MSMFALVKMCKATLVIKLGKYDGGEAISFNSNKVQN